MDGWDGMGFMSQQIREILPEKTTKSEDGECFSTRPFNDGYDSIFEKILTKQLLMLIIINVQQVCVCKANS